MGSIAARGSGTECCRNPYAVIGGNAVHVVFAGKNVREDHRAPVPDIDQYELMEDARTLPLERLVAMKLTY